MKHLPALLFWPVIGSILLASLVEAATPERPNIIYVLADDLGYGDLSCYGQQQLRTPQLDRMAREGMRFERHYAA